MERQLLLSVKKGNYNKQKAAEEVNAIRKMLPGFESFETFAAFNEVFDLISNSVVVHMAKLKTIYNEGLINSTRYRITCKN